MDPITAMGDSTNLGTLFYFHCLLKPGAKSSVRIMNCSRTPSSSYPDTTKAWLESVRLCGELVVGRRVLYYGVPFWRDAITVNVGHKMGPNLRLHFLRIVMLQLNASGSWLSRQRPKL